MKFTDSDGDDGSGFVPSESFLIALESGDNDIILTEGGDFLEQEAGP